MSNKAKTIGQIITVKQLVSFAQREKNVLLCGLHGIGKTSLIVEAFESTFGVRGTDWLYLNAATLDPWVSFIGIPKTVVNANDEEVMRVVPPESMPTSIKAIYIDELNRAPKEVRNAVMELLQFKSINGRRFDNLKVVWSSVNPAQSDAYDVEELDPAQEDRFQIQISLPYDVDKAYFTKKFGALVADESCSWWRQLSQEQRLMVSPRRLEESVAGYLEGDDLRFYLSDKLNIGDLDRKLKAASETVLFVQLISNMPDETLGQYMTIERIKEKGHILENNMDLFKKKILPNVSVETLKAVMGIGRGCQKIKDEVKKSGRLPQEEVKAVIARSSATTSALASSLDRVFSGGNVKPSKNAPMPFIDALEAEYYEAATKAGIDNVSFKGMEHSDVDNNRVFQVMHNWNNLTRRFSSVSEKAAYVMMFMRHNQGRSGIARLFDSYVECKTYDYKTFLIDDEFRDDRIKFILEFSAVCVIINAIRQSYKQGRNIQVSKQADGYFNCGAMKAIDAAFGKMVRSNDIRAILVTAVGLDRVEGVHDGYARSAGMHKENMHLADDFLQEVQSKIHAGEYGEEYGL